MKNIFDKKKNKKGIVDVQFNWIFVMIAGTILFIFIISIVFSQQKNSDKKISLDVTKQLTAAIKGKQQLSNAYSEVTIPRTTITFSCDLGLSYMYVEGSPTREVLKNDVLFAPASINSAKILLWTQDFNLPFTVTRFLYATSQQTAIVVYTESTNTLQEKKWAQELYSDLPANITKFFANDTTMPSINARFGTSNIIVACFSSCPAANLGNRYINITPSDKIDGYGNLTFYTDGVKRRAQFITKPTIYGALFTANVNTYNCTMSRAFAQFEIKRSLVENKLLKISSDMNSIYGNNSICIRKSVYTLPIYQIGQMKNITWNKMYNSTYLSNQLYLDNLELQLRSCPLIY